MKKKSLPQKILRLLRKRSKLHRCATVAQIAKLLNTPKKKTAKAIFLLFVENKLEIDAQLVSLKNTKPRK